MRQTFTVELVDPPETFRVTADGRDVRAWEAGQGRSWMDGVSFTKLAQLAHLTAVRTGAYVGSWESFNVRCVGAEGLDNDAQADAEELVADPTQPAHTDDSSSH